jgi:hypothetical protein
MDTELASTTNSQETQTPAPSTVDSSTSSSAAPAESTAQSDVPATGTEGGVVPPAWTPDFKFKAAGAEHEIPEMYRGLIKDQKSLEEVKRLHEKAFGLDHIAQSRDQLKKQFMDVQPRLQEYENVSKNFERLSHFVRNNDFDSFFQALQIPEKAIVNWIQQKIELSQAPENVRQQHEQNRHLSQQQWEKEQELAVYRARAEEYETAQAFNTVHQSVSQQAGDFAQAYDSRMGEGAFVDLVIDKGYKISQALGREPDLGAVINIVKDELTKLGVVPQQPAAAAAQGTPQGTAVPKQKPTIPVVPAGGHSPVATPVKSMDDLKKRIAALG